MKKLVQQSRFEKLCSHLGGGNPGGGIWIIGIEEGGKWSSESDIDPFISSRTGRVYDWRKPNDSEVLTWRIAPNVSKICTALISPGGSWEQFRRHCYLTQDGPLFMANLYPLSKPRASEIPPDYSAWFGIDSVNDYREQVLNSGRFNRLVDLWKDHGPSLTICHGKGHWNEYRNVLGLDTVTERASDGQIEAYKQGVFLTPHLSWSAHMPQSRIEELVKMARPHWQTTL